MCLTKLLETYTTEINTTETKINVTEINTTETKINVTEINTTETKTNVTEINTTETKINVTEINTTEMKALKCKPSSQFAYNYSINVLSKYSNIISHRSSKASRHINLRRSTHRYPKVNTSIILYLRFRMVYILVNATALGLTYPAARGIGAIGQL